jgi:hypothetical protein
MAVTIDIPPVSYDTPFGKVNKCVWFSVTDNYNTFQVDIRFQRNQRYNATLQLQNYGTQQPNLWSKVYNPTSNPDTVTESLLLTHVPTFNSTIYLLLSS